MSSDSSSNAEGLTDKQVAVAAARLAADRLSPPPESDTIPRPRMAAGEPGA